MSDPAAPKERTQAKTRSPFAILALTLAIYALCRGVHAVLDEMSLVAAVLQAVLAEWGAGRIDVVWSADEAAAQALGKRIGAGVAVGVVAAGLVVAFLASAGAVILSREDAGATGIPAVVIALVTSALFAMRDELLLHGAVLRAIDAASSAPTSPAPRNPSALGLVARVVACGVTSAAASAGEGDPARVVVTKGLLGTLFGALWIEDRGAWMPFAAHAAWLAGTTFLLHGPIFVGAVGSTAWAGAGAGPFGGDAALLAFLPLAAIAVVWTVRRGAARGP